MQPLFSYKPTAYTSVLPGSYTTETAVQTYRQTQQGVYGGGFSKGANSKGGAALLCGSPFDPVPKARPAQNQRFIRTNQKRTDYPDNIQHYLPPRRESMFTHDRANGMSDYANRVQRHAASVRARTSVTLPECKIIMGKTFILSVCDDRSR